MQKVAKFFVDFYALDDAGDCVLSKTIELPSEDAAVYTAKVGAITYAGTAARAVTLEPGSSTILRTYGSVPHPTKVRQREGALTDQARRAERRHGL